MPTPRKRYFNVADAILREPWPREVKLICILLMAWLNTRWARDGIDDDQAGNAVLNRAALVEITGRTQFKSAVNALRTLGEFVSISIEVRDQFVAISWPKFAEFQYMKRRSEARGGPDSPPERDPSNPRPATRDPRREERESSHSKPSARGQGRADRIRVEAADQVEAAIARAAPEAADHRAERRQRLEILSELFVSAGQVAPEAQLRTYCRTTQGLSPPLLRAACDRAFAESEKGFPPPVGTIISAARKIEAEARKRAKDTNQQSRIAAGGEG